MNRRDFLRAGSAALCLGAVGVPRAPTARRALPGVGLPVRRPVPSPAQLRWQRDELALFAHFGVNTFTNREWGTGQESPAVFAPTRLDARQWARAARAGGFRMMILTAKHHDGFCLWPSRYTEHSVRHSPWRDGRGDVVREFADACRAEGLGVGLYLSPWDRHEPTYGDSPRYNEFYVNQLTELMTQYGPVAEVWFDGANGEGPNGKRQVYDWPRYHAVIRRLQPGAVIFSDAGPDVRWIGNEQGTAGDPNWSTVDPAAVPYPGVSGPEVTRSLQHGDARGSVWRPGEADVSIRPGWFWHAAEDDRVRSVENIADLYCRSVGRNSKLLLNVPPTTEGLFSATDVERLAGFGAWRRALFATDLAARARVRASSADGRGHQPGRVVDGDPESFWTPAAGAPNGWVELELPHPVTFDTVCLQEPVAHGQVVERYAVERWAAGAWVPVSSGTTIGYKKLDRVTPVEASRLRVTVVSSLDVPRLGAVALYRSPA